MRFYLTILFLIPFALNAQDFFINNIVVEGNKKTRKRVILRELTFKPGDILPPEKKIEEVLLSNEKRLLNLGLFNDVKVSVEFLDPQKENAIIRIKVNENWYIYPSPIFELADRNFNLWWYELDRDLSRVNYGVRGEHINLSGNNDRLSLTAQWGYTRKLELRYNFPFLDVDGKWASEVNAFYSTVKELAYKTLYNKTQFASYQEETMLSRLRLGTAISYRPRLFGTHILRFEYHRNRINPYAAAELNPDYFLNGQEENKFFYLDYYFSYDTREFLIYPEKGILFGLNVVKEGLYVFNEFNNLRISADWEYYNNFQRKLIWNVKIKAKANLIRNRLGFANNAAIGWEPNEIRGYELYAVDGSDFAFIRTAIHYKFLEQFYDLSSFIPLNYFNKLDIKSYFSFGFDMAYVNERHYIDTNDFSNRLIFGYGPSLNLLFYNTYLFKIDYSFNHTGEGGLFISTELSF